MHENMKSKLIWGVVVLGCYLGGYICLRYLDYLQHFVSVDIAGTMETENEVKYIHSIHASHSFIGQAFYPIVLIEETYYNRLNNDYEDVYSIE